MLLKFFPNLGLILLSMNLYCNILIRKYYSLWSINYNFDSYFEGQIIILIMTERYGPKRLKHEKYFLSMLLYN